MAVTIKDLRFSIYLNNADAVKNAMQFQAQLQKVGDEMAQLSAQGKKDTPEYREKKKAFDDLTKSMEQNKKEAGLLGMSMKELSKLYRSLKSDRDRFVEGSNEWKALDKDLRVVGDRITDVKNKSAETGSSLSKLSTGFNKYFGIVASGVAIFAGLISKMDEYNEKNKQLEVSQKNLQSLTGLSDKDTGWVTKQVAKTSTGADKNGIRITQSSQEILDAMTIVGSQRAELLKNKEALLSVTEDAMKMSIASKDTLEASTEALTNTMNQFNLEGSQSTRIINSLAAGSLVGAGTIPYLSQAIEKAGTTANLMGISVENTIGILEGVAPKFKQAEVAGNSLDKVLMIMKEKQIGYASGVFNMNDALLELKQRYDKGETSVSIFGREHAKMGEVLVQAREKINEYTLGVTGTNVAIEQAAKNSDTYAAKEAQATNRINEAGMALAKNMNGIKLYTKEIFANFMESMSKMTGNTKSATEEFEIQGKRVVDLKLRIEPLLTRYDELAEKTNKSKSEQSELKKIINEVTTAMPGATTAVDKYGNAVAISTNRVREWIDSEVARLGVVNKSAIEENKKSLEQVEKDIKRSKQNIDQINATGTFQVTTQHTTSYGAVISNTRDAGTAEIKAEQDRYRQLIQDKIGYQAEIERLNGATLKKQMADAKKAAAEQAKLDAKAADEKAKSDAKAASVTANGVKDEKNKKAISKLDNELLESGVKLKKAYASGKKSEEDYQEELLGLQVDYLKEKQKLYKLGTNEYNEIENKLADIQLAKTKKAHETALKSFTDLHKSKLETVTATDALLRKTYEDELANGTKTQAHYDGALLALDETTAKARYEIAVNYGNEIKDYVFSNEEEKKKLIDEANKELIAADKDVNTAKRAIERKKIADKKTYEEETKRIREKYRLDEENSIAKQYKKELKYLKDHIKDKKELEKATFKLRLETAGKYAQNVLEIADAASNLSAKIQEAETLAIDNKYAAQLKAAKKAGQDTTKIEEQIEEEKKQVKKKYADLDFAITVAQIISNTALAITKALTLGPVGYALTALIGATGIAQIAVANEQRAAIKNLWTGGYTDDVGERTPAGVVHGGEWVGNAKAVKNPSVRKFLDVFNAAQLDGSIQMLNTTQILERVRAQVPVRIMPSPYTAPMNQQGGMGDNPIMAAMLAENNRTLARLNEHIDNGIIAVSPIAGDYGVAKQLDRYAKMRANASRG